MNFYNSGAKLSLTINARLIYGKCAHSCLFPIFQKPNSKKMKFANFEQKFLFVIILVVSCVLAAPQTDIPEGNPQITTANFVVVFKPAGMHN